MTSFPVTLDEVRVSDEVRAAINALEKATR
jgi:hypothetical protein